MSIAPGRDVPDVPQEWVDAVNKAVNDANHDDLCGCTAWPAACQSYKPGQWDSGVDLMIAVGVLAPLIKQEHAGRIEEQLATVAGIARDLKAYIEVRADEIAGPLITATQERAAERISDVERDAAFEKQRHADLERELRRQLNALVKTTERQQRELKETREAIRRVEGLKVWTNEDRRTFVFADELWEALAESGSPAARAYAELRRRETGAPSDV